MPRSRVLSFMSQWGGGPRSPTAEEPPSPMAKAKILPSDGASPSPTPMRADIDTITPQASALKLDQFAPPSPRSPTTTPSRARGDSRAARTLSMTQTYQAPQVEIANDTPPELQPIFSFLNSHSNKLYQEGYFLKLHDLDSRGRPSPDRVWNECFAQLVGTVLSLWDAAALDAAGEDGEVVPTFVNLSDASIKMIESLPMNGAQGGNLQNVLSISTAANNRYLLHFNSLDSLTQWTAGIRLAMFEHATLQEAYTGSLIAGKGRMLNNIKTIMERSKYPHEDWARVRFGAGTPWKRCWCVTSPPDEKEYQKAQKLVKKSSTYERMKIPKGDIKFYDTRKVTKKTKPIATVTDAYAAYAIYPQSKPLIDQSTLVKLEGLVTVHATPETTTEGFVFVMPEVHAAVSGFEMMLQWLFPVFDAFALYGRPNRLIADTLDQRGLMFALPRDRRYGYLDILDVSAIIHTTGSEGWSDRRWRQELKKLTGMRMTAQMEEFSRNNRLLSQRRSSRAVSPPGRANTMGAVRFDDATSVHSTPGSRSESPTPLGGPENIRPPKRTDSAPPGSHMSPHKRAVSDAPSYKKYTTENPSRLSHETSRPTYTEIAPPPPRHAVPSAGSYSRPQGLGSLGRIQSEAEVPTISSTFNDVRTQTAASPSLMPPAPVVSPPAFTHNPNSRPATQPYQAPELRRAHSNVDAATLSQMQDAARYRDETLEDENGWDGETQHHQQQNPVITNTTANRSLEPPADRLQGVLGEGPTGQQRISGKRLSATSLKSGTSEVAYPLAHNDGVESALPGRTSGHSERVQGPPPVPLHTSRSIARKPLPKKVDVEEDEVFSHTNSMQAALIDQDELERILNRDPSHMDITSSHVPSTTQDHASILRSEPSESRSIEEPRLSSLGAVDVSENSTTDAQSSDAATADEPSTEPAEEAEEEAAKPAVLPTVDFGPTPRLQKRLSPTPSLGRKTPAERAPSPLDIPDNRRSVAWNPVAASSPGGHSLTPEQWVQYRAAQASIPQQAPPRKAVPSFAHQRTASGQSVNQLRKGMTKTPPLSRTPSGDWTQYGPQPGTPPSRPQSRGAGTYFGQSASPSRPHSRGVSASYGGTSPGGMLHSAQPTHLTAKEQMHVARATGSPLISYTSSAAKQEKEQHQPGLFGALAAREREKAEIKKTGRNSMSTNMIQQAISQRQQQQMEAEAQAYAQGQYQMQLQMQQQAVQHAHAQQLQHAQQMQWEQMMQAQQQGAASPGHQQQSRPTSLMSRDSWQPQSQYGGQPHQQQQQQQYGRPPHQRYAEPVQQAQRFSRPPQQDQRYAGPPQQELAQLSWQERQAAMQQQGQQRHQQRYG